MTVLRGLEQKEASLALVLKREQAFCSFNLAIDVVWLLYRYRSFRVLGLRILLFRAKFSTQVDCTKLGSKQSKEYLMCAWFTHENVSIRRTLHIVVHQYQTGKMYCKFYGHKYFLQRMKEKIPVSSNHEKIMQKDLDYIL